MKRGKANRIQGSASDVQSYSHRALRTRLLFVPRLLSERDGKMIDLANQQVICAAHKVSIHTLNHTPPQINTSKYKSAKSKTSTFVVGSWRWKAQSSLGIPCPRTNFSSHKSILHPLHTHKSHKTKINTPSIVCLCRKISCQKAYSRRILLSANSSYISKHKYTSLPMRGGSMDVRRFSRLVNVNGEIAGQKITQRVVFGNSNWFISGGTQKKDGNRPKPEQPGKPKKEKTKPDREGDKGKRKDKSP